MFDSLPFSGRAYEELRRRVLSLPSGSRLPSERDLAVTFSLSRPTIQKLLGRLSAEGLVESRRGSGTYTCPASDPAPKSRKIFFLLPCSDFLTQNCSSALFTRKLLQGMHEELFGTGIFLQTIIVSSDNHPAHLDWRSLERIPRGGQVFVTSLWYRDLFPFLTERECRVILCDAQRDGYDGLPPLRHLLVADFETANESATRELFAAGCRYPALLDFRGANSEKRQEPYVNGYRSAILKHGAAEIILKLSYSETEQRKALNALGSFLASKWRENPFDGLIVPWDACLQDVLDALKPLTESTSVICTRDCPLPAAVPFYSQPGLLMGNVAAKLFLKPDFQTGRTVFQLERNELNAAPETSGKENLALFFT